VNIKDRIQAVIINFDLIGPIVFATCGAQIAYAGSDGAGLLPTQFDPVNELIISEDEILILDDYLKKIKGKKLINSNSYFIQYIQQNLTIDEEAAKAICFYIAKFDKYPSSCYYFVDTNGDYQFSDWNLELYRSLINVESWENMSDEELQIWLDILEGSVELIN